MDCYILSVQDLADKNKISESLFSFLTNYSITKCWIDTKMSSSFGVPIIYPSRFTNVEDIKRLYPGLTVKRFDDFSSYFSFLKKRVKKEKAVIAFDRYYLDYILPKRHMGAHYVVVKHVSEDHVITYFDYYDKKMHTMTLSELKSATEETENVIQYEGYVVLYNEFLDSHLENVCDKEIKDILEIRVRNLEESIDFLKKQIEEHVKDERLCKFYFKLALGGITYSDFRQQNGRYENYEFFKSLNLKFEKFAAFLICKMYVAFALIEGVAYKKSVITERRWKLFCRRYMRITKFELWFYRKVLGRHKLISKHLKAII